MIRRHMLLAGLAGLMFGCQTLQHVQETGKSEQPEIVEKQTPAETVEDRVKGTASAVEENAAQAASEMKAPVQQEMLTAAPVDQPGIKERNTVMILMKTSKGDIKLELDKEKAPKTVANFLGYVESGHYNGTIFHRVIDGFMIQGGGFDESMNQKPAPNTVENEAANGLKNGVGSVAMARTNDPHSAGAQFFINVNDNTFLNYPGQDGWGYCVFGQVVEGMDVVNDIKGVPTGNAGFHQNVPTEPVTIAEVNIIEE